ncbi:MAG: hypothetical protein D6785_11580 [Planctomycetota bacterium]|nr:MAG: hypothetical protein D6785_11580 [Planctomycetota bacterium]
MYGHQITIGLGLQTIITFTKKGLKIEYNVGFSRSQAFYEKQRIDTNKDRKISSQELDDYLKKLGIKIQKNMMVAIDGHPVRLRMVHYRDDGTVEGEIRPWPMDLWYTFEGDIQSLKKPGVWQVLEYQDRNYPPPTITQSLIWVPFLQEVSQFQVRHQALEDMEDSYRVMDRAIKIRFQFRKPKKKIKKVLDSKKKEEKIKKSPKKEGSQKKDVKKQSNEEILGLLATLEWKINKISKDIEEQKGKIAKIEKLLKAKGERKNSQGPVGSTSIKPQKSFHIRKALKVSEQEKQILAQTQKWNEIFKREEALYLILGIFLAFFYGSLHALSPGHGKTMVAAYLIGTKGRIRDAVTLGIIVTITHTASVYLLWFFITYYAYSWFGWNESTAQSISEFWLALASGLLFIGMGVILYFTRLRGGGHTHFHLFGGHHHHHHHSHHADHNHEHHHHHHHFHHADHNHEHHHHHHHSHHADHNHEHHQHHESSLGMGKSEEKVETKDNLDSSSSQSSGKEVPKNEKDTPPTFWEIFWLGLAGGIIPCPGGLAILGVAYYMKKFELGLALLISFSLGLSLVLIIIGIMMVTARSGISSFVKEGGFFVKIQWLKNIFQEKFLQKLDAFSFSLVPFLPAVSAIVIVLLGTLIIVKDLVWAVALHPSMRPISFPAPFDTPRAIHWASAIFIILFTLFALYGVIKRVKKLAFSSNIKE